MRKKRVEWARVAEEFERSGLTQKAFAQQRRMSIGTLQNWIYKHRRQATAPAQALRLLPVQVAGVAVGEALEVTSVSGARLRVPIGADVAYVARLVAALG